MAGKTVPRVPTGPLAVHFCAPLAGCTLRGYSTDARALADSVLRYHERFKPDAVWVSADTWVSAEAMGAKVGAADDNQPLGGIGAPLVRCAADIDRIPAPDVGAQGRYPLMLEALSRIVRELGREVFIVGCLDQYPFSLAAALMGINQIMTRIVDDPAFVRALMLRCEEYGSGLRPGVGQRGGGPAQRRRFPGGPAWAKALRADRVAGGEATDQSIKGRHDQTGFAAHLRRRHEPPAADGDFRRGRAGA